MAIVVNKEEVNAAASAYWPTLDVDIFYFAHPYHSWERGLNEHINGLIRQYFPKGSSLENISVEQVMSVQNKLNHGLGKILGYKVPYEVLLC